MSLNRLVLVINASYEPIQICSARRALTLLFKGAAVVEQVSTHFVRTPKISIPLPDVIRLHQQICAAAGCLPEAKVVGIALNFHKLSDEEARRAVEQTHAETGLPVTDVIRFGCDPLLRALRLTTEAQRCTENQI